MSLPGVGAKLNSPDHRLKHRVHDVDETAPDETIKVTGGTVTTTDATPTVAKSIALDDNTAYLVKSFVVGRGTAGAERAAAIIYGFAYRQSAGSAVLADAGTPFLSETDAGMDIVFSVSGNNLQVEVTGKAATTINWRASLQFTKVI